MNNCMDVKWLQDVILLVNLFKLCRGEEDAETFCCGK